MALLRNILPRCASGLTALVLSGALATSCITTDKISTACGSDADCFKDEICQNRVCVSYHTANSCQNDYDCPGELVCEDYRCVDNHNSSSPSNSPEQVANEFANYLAQGDLERSLECCIDPAVQETYRRRLGSQNLAKIGEILTKARLVKEDGNDPERQIYNYEYEGIEFPLIMHKEQKGWKIHAF